ncbi:MAG: alpha/beta hydrolase fold domain-containing protein [Candidatus Acidiferrum sp.]
MSKKILAPPTLLLGALFLYACAKPAQAPPPLDSATFDPGGTAHITRTVPMPTTISPEAQRWLASLANSTPSPEDLATRRKRTDEWRARQSAVAKQLFPVNIASTTTAGVPTDIITPLETPAANRDLVLINLHGGGFNSDSGSLIEGDPICNLAKIKVVSVYYRLAPEHPFPAPVDDVVAVYKELLKTYNPRNIGIFGTSAGAILTAEVAVRLKQLNLPLPAALASFPLWPTTLALPTPCSSSLSTVSPALLNRKIPINPSARNTPAASTAKIPSFPPFTPTSMACLRPSSSPAPGICFSATPRFSIAPSSAPASMPNSSCSRLFPMPSGTTSSFPKPPRPSTSWLISSPRRSDTKTRPFFPNAPLPLHQNNSCINFRQSRNHFLPASST